MEEFSLGNGALVHNSSHAADALRYLALSVERLAAYAAWHGGPGPPLVASGLDFDLFR